MITWRSGVSASSGCSGCMSRNGAIGPTSPAPVTPNARRSSQKCVMENCSRSTMRARKYDAWYSIALPETWNAGYIA